MIESLRVKNLALIFEAQVEFTPGLNVITGETGAGKTMLLSSLQLISGAKADPALVRQGEEKAFVEATVLAGQLLREAVRQIDGFIEDGAVEIGRSIGVKSRSKAQLGGRSVPAGVLAEAASTMLSIHGQSDQWRLKDTSAQRVALDSFADPLHIKALNNYRKIWDEWKLAQNEWNEFHDNCAERKAQLELWKTHLEALNELNPQKEEYAQLGQIIARMSNVEQLRNGLTIALSNLETDENSPAPSGASDLLIQSVKEINKLTEQDPQLESVAKILEECGYLVQDASSQIQTYLRELDADPVSLENALNRRADWNSLSQRIGIEPTELYAYHADIMEKLDATFDDETQSQRLKEKLDRALDNLEKAKKELHKRRKNSANKLSKMVNAELQGLAMSNAIFSIHVTQKDPNENGGDDVNFFLKPHAESDELALGRSASGGELSRIMLALEVSLASRKSLESHTFVFDEIDAGIGGQAGIEVGRRLAQLANNHQVIVVTHLPQVAAFANRHIRVIKDKKGTKTNFEVLNDEERRSELARMLSGQIQSQTALRHADELMRLANVGQFEA